MRDQIIELCQARGAARVILRVGVARTLQAHRRLHVVLTIIPKWPSRYPADRRDG